MVIAYLAVMVLGAVLVLGLGRFLRWDATSLLSVYLVTLIVIPATQVLGPMGSIGQPATILSFVLAGWWALSRISLGTESGPTRIERNPVRIAAFAYAWVFLLTYATAYGRVLSSAERSGADRAAILTVASIGLLLLVADGVNTRQRLETLLFRLALLCGLLAAVGLLEGLSHVNIARYIHLPGLAQHANTLSDLRVRNGFSRAFATSAHPIEFGVVIAMGLPLAIHYWRFAESAVQRRSAAVAALCILAAAPFSVSRSTLLALAVGCLVAAQAWTWRIRANALVLMALVVGFFHSAVPGLLGTLGGLIFRANSDPSVSGRTSDYATIGGYLVHHRLLGIGLGTFVPEKYIYVDNQYLITAVQSGYLGLAVLIGLLLTALVCARWVFHHAPDLQTRHLGNSLAAAIAVLAVSLATFDGFAFRQNCGVAFVLMGACGALWRMVRAQIAADQRAGKTRAGAPTATPPAGTSLVTTELAPTTAF